MSQKSPQLHSCLQLVAGWGTVNLVQVGREVPYRWALPGGGVVTLDMLETITRRRGCGADSPAGI